jgi:hypothetical protein
MIDGRECLRVSSAFGTKGGAARTRAQRDEGDGFCMRLHPPALRATPFLRKGVKS